MSADPLAGWVPFFLRRDPAGPWVEWGYAGERRFVEPFLHQTFTALMHHPFNELFRRRTSLEALLERAERFPGLPPAGIVFHMSRCGSTLAAQALATLPDSVVLSEPEPLDSLLGLLSEAAGLADETKPALVRAMVAALGQPRRPGDRRLFLKADAWHIAWAGLLLRAFPGTPWIFLYRDPVEVLESHRRRPGAQLIPGTLPPGYPIPPGDEPHWYDPVEYGARLFSTILTAAVEALAAFPGGRAVAYRELPGALWGEVADHFRLDLDAAGRAALEEACRRDAKEPHLPFAADSADKQQSAGEALRRLAERWLEGPYRRLEELAAG